MYVCVRLHLCMCVRDYIHVCMCETTFIYVRLHLCMCVWNYIYVCVFETTFTYVCVNNMYQEFIKLWNYQNKSCRSPWVIQLWYSLLFQLKWFGGPNYGFNLSFFKFQNLKGSNLVKWQDNQNKTCRSWWVEQLLYSSFLHLKSFRGSKLWFELVFFQISKFERFKFSQMIR